MSICWDKKSLRFTIDGVDIPASRPRQSAEPWEFSLARILEGDYTYDEAHDIMSEDLAIDNKIK